VLSAQLWPNDSHAQEAGDDAARIAAARSLFQEGLSLLDREEWAQAEDRFERALALRPSAQIAYNLSTALIAMGHLVRASEVLLIGVRDETAPSDVREASERRRQEILPRIPKLTIQVSGDRTGAEIRVDERAIEWAMVGVAVPVDPGPHEITAIRDGEVIASDSVVLSEGGRAQTSLALPVAAPTPAETAEAADPVRPAGPPPVVDDGGSTWWVWTLAAVVLVGGGIATFFLLQPKDADAIDGSAGVVRLGLGGVSW